MYAVVQVLHVYMSVRMLPENEDDVEEFLHFSINEFAISGGSVKSPFCVLNEVLVFAPAARFSLQGLVGLRNSFVKLFRYIDKGTEYCQAYSRCCMSEGA